MSYAILDEYDADLLNETPPRRESVTEIQDREQGDLLCYANPKHAAYIVKAVNVHDELLAALTKCEAVIGSLLEHPPEQAAEIRAQGFTGYTREIARALVAKLE